MSEPILLTLPSSAFSGSGPDQPLRTRGVVLCLLCLSSPTSPPLSLLPTPALRTCCLRRQSFRKPSLKALRGPDGASAPSSSSLQHGARASRRTSQGRPHPHLHPAPGCQLCSLLSPTAPTTWLCAQPTLRKDLLQLPFFLSLIRLFRFWGFGSIYTLLLIVCAISNEDDPPRYKAHTSSEPVSFASTLASICTNGYRTDPAVSQQERPLRSLLSNSLFINFL